MSMNRSQFPKQLQEGLNAVFGVSYKEHQEEWSKIFTTEASNKAFEEDVLMSGLGGAQIKPEGASVAFDTGSEGWVSRYNHTTIALAFAITKEAEEDGLYGTLGKKYAKALARSMQFTKEITGANVLNNGFNPAEAGGDGVSLYSIAHPLIGGGTFANKLVTPADLSETALEDALIAIDGFVDDRNIPIKAKVKGLCVPKELRFVAERILGSEYRTGSPDNDINAIYSGGYIPGGYSVNHYLTDPDAWFLTTDVDDGLKHFVRKGIERGVEGDFETGNMRYKARERYSFGWTDPRGTFGSEGV